MAPVAQALAASRWRGGIGHDGHWPLGAYNPCDAKPNEWASLRDEFNAMVRESADTIEDLLDEQFRRRFGELMYRTARARRRDRSEATAEMSPSF